MATQPARTAELASIISNNIAIINEYHSKNGLPPHSFNAEAPPTYNYPSMIETARQEVIAATDELHAMIAGPFDTLGPIHNQLVAIHALYRFKIANNFPDEQDETTYDQLARACGLEESALRRIVRVLIAHRIFCEPRKGVVAHTMASKFFASNETMRYLVGMVTEELWPAATRMVDAIERWPGSQEPNQTGFNIAHNTEESLFSTLDNNPVRAERFAKAMTMLNSGPDMDPRHVADNYDWAALGEKVVMVDVGGSHGDVSIAVARKFPNVSCIVQDLAGVIASSNIPVELQGQIGFMAHDFFTEQPVKDADVYFLKWILHDWSDQYAIKILRALIPALKKGARIVVNEFVVPEPGIVPIQLERMIRLFDVAMWESQNGKEREAADWANLFQSADPRLKLTNIIQPPTSGLGIIEATWDI